MNVSRLHEWAAVPPPAVNESVVRVSCPCLQAVSHPLLQTEQPPWQSAAPARSASEVLLTDWRCIMSLVRSDVVPIRSCKSMSAR